MIYYTCEIKQSQSLLTTGSTSTVENGNKKILYTTQAWFKHANFLIKYQNQMLLKMSDN